ncbi:MAG: hypothetical protein M4579_003941 [Chaenotheca gracillima]|nr:MAG: hypothetical protein M4579_003941 [Chaenotheca gracillima]
MAPLRSRPSDAIARTSAVRQPPPTTATMPEYQPPTHPLTPASVRTLISLPQSHSLTKLQHHLKTANETVTHMAGEVNDRLWQKQEMQRRRRVRRPQPSSQGPEGGEDDEEAAAAAAAEEALAEMGNQVENMTAEMEARTRGLIDAEAKLEALQDVLKEVGNKANVDLVNPPGTQHASASQRRRRPRRQQIGSDEDDEDDEDFDEEEEEPLNHRRGSDAENNGPLKRLRTEAQRRTDAYDRKSQRHKYAAHNSYIGFKRTVHDAQNPGDEAPPVPHADTWFPEAPTGTASDSNRPATRQHADSDDNASDSSEDIAIAREKTSLRCPLTLLPFKDPVTSAKCPHSFERTAILDMIAQSSVRIGGGARSGRGAQAGEKAVSCPVCGEKMLTVGDLRPDPVLARRVKRLQRMEEEGEEEEDVPERKSQRLGNGFKEEGGGNGRSQSASQMQGRGGGRHDDAEDSGGFANLDEELVEDDEEPEPYEI